MGVIDEVFIVYTMSHLLFYLLTTVMPMRLMRLLSGCYYWRIG
jgi:hypothetical protein